MSTYVRVGGEHEGEIAGLCGNLNTNSQDDWTSADRILQSAVSPFANSWKTDPVCPDHTETSKDPVSLQLLKFVWYSFTECSDPL